MKFSLLITSQAVIFSLSALSVILLYFWVDPTQNINLFLFLMSLAVFLAMSTGLSLTLFFLLNILRRGYVFFLDVVRILRRSIFFVMFVFCVYFFDRLGAFNPLSFFLVLFVFVVLELLLSKIETSGK